jgi:hypothetical protein
VIAQLTTQTPGRDLLVEAGRVYAAAFEAPTVDGAEDPAAISAEIERFCERVEHYAGDRDGFRLATVRDDDGLVAAIGLAVLARPGDWWRDHVARALGPEGERRFLGELCLEVVHIAVLPKRQRNGFGGRVHDVLVGGAPAPRAVLSCHDQALPARRLYEGRGWVSVGRLPMETGTPFHIMSLRLDSDSPA